MEATENAVRDARAGAGSESPARARKSRRGSTLAGILADALTGSRKYVDRWVANRGAE